MWGCDGSRISSRLEVVRGRIVRVSSLTDRRGGGYCLCGGEKIIKTLGRCSDLLSGHEMASGEQTGAV